MIEDLEMFCAGLEQVWKHGGLGNPGNKSGPVVHLHEGRAYDATVVWYDKVSPALDSNRHSAEVKRRFRQDSTLR